MSYILRNLTRGDLSLTNVLNIKHNGYTTVEEITESMKDEERRGIISISTVVEEEVPVVEEKEKEKEEVPVVVEEEEVPVVEEEEKEKEVEYSNEQELLKQSEVADTSSKPWKNHDQKNKFKK